MCVRMIEVLSLLFLSIAVSIDSFMVAFSYGLKKLTLSKTMIALIGLFSGLTFGMAMMTGQFFAILISETLVGVIGALLLIGLGCYSLLTFDQKQDSQRKSKKYQLEFKSIGIVIRIYQKPTLADFDQSGDIRGWEVIWLALALSIDAGAAGLGASLIGVRLIAIPLIILMTISFLALGIFIGSRFAQKELQNWVRYLPGILLILIGLSRLFVA